MDSTMQDVPLAVVVKDGAALGPAELRRHLDDRVVRWWLPERWTFVDEIPRTTVGKFDKKLIRARYADGAFDIVECHD